MSTKRRRDLIVDGYEFRELCFVKDGYAVRYKLLRNGKWQILNVLPPGDLMRSTSLMSDAARRSNGCRIFCLSCTNGCTLSVAPRKRALLCRFRRR